LITQQKVSIVSEGDLVAITIGNSTLRMRYNDALLFSQWIRVRAKEAKRFAGDTGHHWSLLGTLHDAERPIGRF
jgi:hypothetical protein